MHVHQSAGQNTSRSKEKLKVDKSIYYRDEHHVQEVVTTAVVCRSTEQNDTVLKNWELKHGPWNTSRCTVQVKDEWMHQHLTF